MADAAILVQALGGYDPEDTTSVNLPGPDYSKALDSLEMSVRLGVPRALFYENLNPDIKQAINQALAVLRRFAGDVQDVELPEVKALPVGPTRAEIYAYHAGYMAETPQLYQRETLERLRPTAEITAAAYIHGARSIERLRRAVTAVFRSAELLVTPITFVPPATIAGAENRELELIRQRQLSPLVRNTAPFNIYGLPSISVPCGFTRDGLRLACRSQDPPGAKSRCSIWPTPTSRRLPGTGIRPPGNRLTRYPWTTPRDTITMASICYGSLGRNANARNTANTCAGHFGDSHTDRPGPNRRLCQ